MKTQQTNPTERLRYHVTGAIERGEAEPIIEQSAPNKPILEALLNASESFAEDKAQHSPLTVRIITRDELVEGFRQNPEGGADNFIRAVNHADKLAEALRKLINRLDNITSDDFARGAERIEREAARNELAAFRNASQD